MRQTPKITVALSGPDNVGKTTHARLLQRRAQAHNPGPLDHYDPRWQHAHTTGLADWWFHAAPIEIRSGSVAGRGCRYAAREAGDRGDRVAYPPVGGGPGGASAAGVVLACLEPDPAVEWDETRMAEVEGRLRAS
ncbi:hypothetical protein [Spongiactinospora sp. 9N601]|uniref:hypothetical protein n=1 Tax=Spongiactinospora sp. 9N601 TaxID=3375149 RepID=UPI0037A5487C